MKGIVFIFFVWGLALLGGWVFDSYQQTQLEAARVEVMQQQAAAMQQQAAAIAELATATSQQAAAIQAQAETLRALIGPAMVLGFLGAGALLLVGLGALLYMLFRDRQPRRVYFEPAPQRAQLPVYQDTVIQVPADWQPGQPVTREGGRYV